MNLCTCMLSFTFVSSQQRERPAPPLPQWRRLTITISVIQQKGKRGAPPLSLLTCGQSVHQNSIDMCASVDPYDHDQQADEDRK